MDELMDVSSILLSNAMEGIKVLLRRVLQRWTFCAAGSNVGEITWVPSARDQTPSRVIQTTVVNLY